MTDSIFYISDDDPPAKRRILEEGLRLFAERGLSATSIRDIASATGYSNPALYKHFKTKDELALVLFERSYKELMHRINLALSRATGFSEKFGTYVKTFCEFYDEHPHASIFTTNNLAVLWPRVSGTMGDRTVITITRQLLEDGKQEGLVSKTADLSLLLVLVTGTINQLNRQFYLNALEGPAKKHAAGIEKILRAGLS